MQIIRIGGEKCEELQLWFYETLHYIVVKTKTYDVWEIVVSWLQPSDWGLRTRLPQLPAPTMQFQSQVFLELEGPVTAVMYVKILSLTEIKGKTKGEKIIV